MEELPPKRTHFKRRRRHEARSPADVVQALLNSPKMHGVLEGSAVWLAVSSNTLHILEHAVLGLVDGGPATMRRTLHILAMAGHSHVDTEHAGGTDNAAGVSSSKGAPGNNGITENEGSYTSVRLSLQEAMFMVHALQHLVVYTLEAPDCVKALSAQALWSVCCSLRPAFWQSYVAMQHYRLKGLYPRSGIQYGCTYVLYRQRPAICHSDFCVVVLDAKSSTQHNPSTCMYSGGAANAPKGGSGAGISTSNRMQDPSNTNHLQQWFELQIANRLASQVSKRLLLLYVDVGPGVDTHALSCLAHVTVQEVGVRRWTVSRGLPPSAPVAHKGGGQQGGAGRKQQQQQQHKKSGEEIKGNGQQQQGAVGGVVAVQKDGS